MIVIFNLLLIIVVPGSIILIGLSVVNIKAASKRSCNSELGQLAHLDGTIAKFHKRTKRITHHNFI